MIWVVMLCSVYYDANVLDQHVATNFRTGKNIVL